VDFHQKSVAISLQVVQVVWARVWAIWSSYDKCYRW